MMLYHGAKDNLRTSIYEQFPGPERYEAVKWSGKEHTVRDRWGISAGRAFKPRSRKQRAKKFLLLQEPTNFPLHILISEKAGRPFTPYLLLPSYTERIHSAIVEVYQPHKWNEVTKFIWEKAGIPKVSINTLVLWEKFGLRYANLEIQQLSHFI